jgi:hypothetical protein
VIVLKSRKKKENKTPHTAGVILELSTRGLGQKNSLQVQGPKAVRQKVK